MKKASYQVKKDMTEKKENKIIRFIKKYAAGLAAGCVILLLLAYFVNLIFVKNKRTAVSVLVLEFMEDTSGLERQVREAAGADEDEKIEIRTISYGVQANKAVALTWIRAEVVDVIIGEEEQMLEFAQAGYLRELSETNVRQSNDFMCGLAEFDREGKITATGPDKCFGKYAGEIPGIDFQNPVIGLADNVTNGENAAELLHYFEKSNE